VKNVQAMASPHLLAENFSMNLRLMMRGLDLRKLVLKWTRFGHRNAIERIVSCGESAERTMGEPLNVADTAVIFRNNIID